MPIYEYICEDCGTKYEKVVLNRAQDIACPKCESPKKTLQLSVFSTNSGGANGASDNAQASSSPSFSGGACCGGGGCGCH